MKEFTDIIEFMDNEIEKELGVHYPHAVTNFPDAEPTEAAAATDPPPKLEGANKVARKPFVITDFESPRDKEMAVFTHAKKLSEYIFVITEKSPIKHRWSIVSRLINTSMEIIESLYRANYERGEERVLWQKKAMIALNVIDFYAHTAKTKRAITFKQMVIIARQINEIKLLLNGWIRSTKRAEKSVEPPQVKTNRNE